MKKFNVGDSVKFKDGRTGKVVDYTNTHYIVKDSNGNQVKVKMVKDTTSTLLDAVAKNILEHIVYILDTGYEIDREEVIGNTVAMLCEPEKYALAETINQCFEPEEANFILDFVKKYSFIDWRNIPLD